MKLNGIMFATVCALACLPQARAETDLSPHWEGEYWYENGVRCGTMDDDLCVIGDGVPRGREIYDPGTDAWYWLDAERDGAKAISKEVWMPYVYSDEEPGSTQGKWVRYDENGLMVKGWFVSDKGTYYYHRSTGALAKGKMEIDGKMYYFHEVTGIMLINNQAYLTPREEMDYTGWKTSTGRSFWYENGVRQGTVFDPKGVSFDGLARGREIFDPDTDAWYWLDADNDGAMAKSKEVFMPYVYSDEKPGSTVGKWVRYDKWGKMIHGLYEQGDKKWYYDETTGMMMHDVLLEVGGYPRYFDSVTGLMRDIVKEIPRACYIRETSFGMKGVDAAASAFTALQTQGYCQGMNFKTFAQTMPRHKNDPRLGFVKDAEHEGGIILPEAYVEWLGQYGKAKDVSNCSNMELAEHIKQGDALVIWASTGFHDAEPMEEEWGMHFKQDHLCILSGYNSITNEFLIVDSIDGYRWHPWQDIMDTWGKIRYAVSIESLEG